MPTKCMVLALMSGASLLALARPVWAAATAADASAVDELVITAPRQEAQGRRVQPLRYYEGSPNRPIQREFYDIAYEGGVRASF